MKTITVIGGGITGLCTLFYLQQFAKEQQVEVDFKLIEKNEYLGGKIHSHQQDGFIIETGADSIVARHKSVMALIKELSFEDELVYNATGISYILRNNELHAIPAETVFGIPMSVDALNRSTLISEEGKQRAMKDFEMQDGEFTKDSSIREFLEYYLGEEIVEKQIAPVLSGVYSGKLENLTMASTLPYLVDYKKQYGSIIKGFSENKAQFEAAANKKFISFKNGLSSIIDRLEQTLTNVGIKKGVAISSITKQKEGYEVTCSNQETFSSDFVVLAIPHDAAQAILSDSSMEQDFQKLQNSSLISIYLGFDLPDEILPADGTGYIVSENNDVKCDACTWTSRKWKHTSQKSHLLIRMFYKSSNPHFAKMKHMSEEQLIEVALQDIETSLQIVGKPNVVKVTKWNEAMPNYHLEHATAIKQLESTLQEYNPNILLAGCSYYGVGIGACIQNGKDTAERIIELIKQ